MKQKQVGVGDSGVGGKSGRRWMMAALSLCAVANAQTCERFHAIPVEQQAQILASNDRSDGDCTAFLIKIIGAAHYEPAAQTIAKYLDFEWQEADPPVRQMPEPFDIEKFPAFGALYSIGERSAPAVIEYLGSRNLSGWDLSRNVLLVVELLQPRMVDVPNGVRALVRASRGAKEPITAGMLWRAAMEAVVLCSLPACQAALLERPKQ